MKLWQRRQLRRFGAVPAAPVAPAPPAQAPRNRPSIESMFSLGVAGLACITSIITAKITYDERNTPFRTLIYEREVSRVFDAIDFLQRQRFDLSEVETEFDVGLTDPAAATSRITAMGQGYARIVSESWMYSDAVTQKLAAAAIDFNRFSALCLRSRYAQPDAIGAPMHRRFVFSARCADLFEQHQRSSNLAERALRDYVGFDSQRDAIAARFAGGK